MKKKNGVLLLLVCICVIFIFPTNAIAEKATTDKAGALNKLTVLRGDGNSYNLDGQITRGEAAAFIIRIMGKEHEVLENSSRYNETGFPDVQKNQWFAPYIGFCAKQGIVGGFPNGSYAPNDPISEKAFLKLALGVLGYKYNIDFNWDNIYVTAYNSGLILDYTYQSKLEDNVNYKRREVVNVLYNSLNRPNRKTKVTVLDDLIENGVITRSIAVSIGLKKDTLVTEISGITVVNQNQIRIKLNESIKELNSSKIMIYEADNEGAAMPFTIKSQIADELLISTTAQTLDKKYTITLTDIEDMEGNISDKLIGNFTGYRNPEVSSDFFKIKKIDTVSKNLINVYFTQPIDMNSELPMYYEILEGSKTFTKGTFQTMSVKTVGMAENVISIFLKEKTLTDGVIYTLKADGNITGVYGLKIKDGNGDSMNFTANGAENTGFHVANVNPLYNYEAASKSYIRIDFNKEFDATQAQQWITNYSVVDSNGIPRAIIGGVIVNDGVLKNQSVILTLAGVMDSAKKYELTISNIQDKFNQMNLPQNVKYPFQGISKAKEILSIVNVAADDRGTLTVFFNRPLNASSATNTGFYNVVGIANPTSIYFNPNEPYMVRLFFTANLFSAPNTYTLKVLPGVTDCFNDVNFTDMEALFNGSNVDYLKPLMIEALIVGKDAIRVRTNREITTGALNMLTSNYSLDYKDGSNNTVAKTPISINFVDVRTLIFRFDTLDFTKEYTFRFLNSLTDYTGGVARLPADGLDSVHVVRGK